MTKKRKTNPFGIKGFNSNNPLGIKGFNSKNPLGIKMPRIQDPFKEIRRASRNMDRQYNIKITKISMPKPQPLRRISLPKITFSRTLATPTALSPRIATRPISRTLLPKISTQSSIFNPRPAESILSPRASDTIFNERRAGQPVVSILGTQYNSVPTLADIIKDARRKFDEYREKNKRAWEAEKQARLQNELQRQRSRPEIIIQPVPTHAQVEHSISQINEKLAQKDKEVSELQNKVKKVSDDVTELKEKMTILENYDHELREVITPLLKIQKEKGLETPAEVTALLTELLKEKQKNEEKIKNMEIELKKVVDQQKKDVPFNQSLRKILDDARFDDKVI